jgi:DNA repair exonuclease SbcCD ATPase subunit
LNAEYEKCAERLEQARSSLRELDELRDRERELRDRLELLGEEADGRVASLEELDRSSGDAGPMPETPAAARVLLELAGDLEAEILNECRTRLLHRGGRRLNRLTGGRILGLELGGEGGEVQLVDSGGSAGVEADEDRAAAMVALRMALAELLSEEWSPLGSFILGDPFDRMGAEDQLRALSLLRGILSRIPQVLLLTRGSVLERAPEFFDGLYEFREETERGLPPLRALPAGVGTLQIR